MTDDLRWYAVMTNARAEWLAHQELRRQGYDTLYLHYLGTVRHAGKERFGVMKPYFPRYLFVGAGPGQAIGPINKTQGVSTLVYFGEDPLAVPRDVIEELRGRGDSNGTIAAPKKEERQILERGTDVRLLAGPFIGFIGTVALDRGKSIMVWLRLFDRSISAAFGPEDLEVLNPDGGAFMRQGGR